MSIVERALAKASAIGRASASGARPATEVRRPVAVGAKDDLKVDESRHVDLAPTALRAAGVLPPVDMEQRVAEEIRVIKRPLLLNAESNDAVVPVNRNLIMIGSALPGAGKTFLSLNLALSIAIELDWTVLLIDADVIKRALSRSLGLADQTGLVSLLEDESRSLSDCVFKTNLPGLHVLPAGPSRPNVRELFGSQRMRALIGDLARLERRLVVIDSPPLLLTSEARVLASHVGQVVLVVEAGVTPRQSVFEAIETLDSSKAINLVLNKNRQRFGHGYSYGTYPAYGSETDEKREG
jgi:exopolysaccharide/PEP-CTERM locus tyrosine autokinase